MFTANIDLILISLFRSSQYFLFLFLRPATRTQKYITRTEGQQVWK